MSDADFLPPFMAGIFAGDGTETELIGSRCPKCGDHQFPRAAICPRDLTETTPANLGRTGTLYSYTIVRTKPPFGLPSPYAIGYVDLEGTGLRILMPLDAHRIDQLRIDIALQLVSGPMGIGLDGHPCRRPYFTPVGRSD